MSKKVQLEGNFGGSREDVYPATMAEIVYTQDGKNLEEKMNETNAQLSQKINHGEGGVITSAMLSQEVKESMTGGSVAVVGKNAILTENIVDKQVSPNKLSERVYDGWLWDVNCRTVSANQTTYLSILVPTNVVVHNGEISMSADVELENYELYDVSIAFFNATTPTNISSSVLTCKSTEYPQFFTKNETGFSVKFNFSNRVATSENIACMIAIYLKSQSDKVINFKVKNLKLNDIYLSKSFPFGLFTSAPHQDNNVQLKTDEYCLAKKQDLEYLEKIVSGIVNSSISKWRGKIINILGDSITFGVGATSTDKRYANLLAEKLGCTVNNYGISGTYISHMTNNNGFVDRYNVMTDDCDGVIVYGGNNDYWVGEIELSVFRNDLITLIDGLNTKYVGKEIYFITPYNQYWQTKNSDSLNSVNAKLEDYVNIIKKECKSHGIKVIDLFGESGMDIAHNKIHRGYYANSELDGVHPNDNGHAKIADIIVRKIY